MKLQRQLFNAINEFSLKLKSAFEQEDVFQAVEVLKMFLAGGQVETVTTNTTTVSSSASEPITSASGRRRTYTASDYANASTPKRRASVSGGHSGNRLAEIVQQNQQQPDNFGEDFEFRDEDCRFSYFNSFTSTSAYSSRVHRPHHEEGNERGKVATSVSID